MTSYKAVAPPTTGLIPAVRFHDIVIDGIVRRRDGTIPGGPNVAIPPPSNQLASNGAAAGK